MESGKAVKSIMKGLLIANLAIAGTNLFCAWRAERHGKHSSEGCDIYDWKHGKILYKVSGNGPAVLLIHGLEPQNSGRDLDARAAELAANHTVYTIDLLGFGDSDKPWITYTNYLYVLLIQNFIKDVIGENAEIIAFEGSCLLTLQAYATDPEHISGVTLMNPDYKEEFAVSTRFSKWFKRVIDIPFYGTFVYNLYSLVKAVPYKAETRHAFASRLSGHLTSSLEGKEALINGNVTIVDEPKEDPLALSELYD